MKHVMRLGVSTLMVLGSALAVAGEVEVPAVSGAPYTIQPGEERKVKWLRDGREVISTVRLLDDETIQHVRDDGCSYVRSIEDRYPPNLRWSGCNPGKWGSGSASDISKEGRLWPFQVGNRVRYDFRATNKKGKTKGGRYRECEVTGTETVEAAGREYAAYRIDCDEHSGTRTYWYAPEVENTVRVVRDHKKRGRTVNEFVERLQ